MLSPNINRPLDQSQPSSAAISGTSSFDITELDCLRLLASDTCDWWSEPLWCVERDDLDERPVRLVLSSSVLPCMLVGELCMLELVPVSSRELMVRGRPPGSL